ncbi:hypothetical protein CYMTET_9951 [Cymbomonas tetramitiformis]|uniref:non-specific serine/threonine protein kinase n=1 Tax=Cymbomonas tetramitiformis TaxID=36881 RepID=A0AAE0GQR3_9CHLO|nr:hypothetical protein CYMTET_9951 [Cymbomonas tetramitiformis]
MERYVVEKRIGVGSYGSAYLVHFRKDRNVKCVLKKIRLDNVGPKERAAAHQEVKLLSQLSHPFVLGYIDSFQYKNFLCIVTEFCEAGDLYNKLKSCKTYLKEEQVVEWFVQLLSAIQYLHERKVLHRDLKTQNVFLTKEGNIKLGDFGIARVLNAPVEMAMTVIGTPYYMSPEIMESKPYDFKSDLWAFGCVLYELTSLKHAFDAQDMNGLVMKILRGKYGSPPAHFSPELRQVVSRLLSKEPEQRPSCEQLNELAWVKSIMQQFSPKLSQLRREEMDKISYLKACSRGEIDKDFRKKGDQVGETRMKVEAQLQKEHAQKESVEEKLARLQALPPRIP